MRDNIMTPRKQFEAELDTIADTIIKLADGTKDMLIKAVKGLYNQDITQAKEIIKADKRLDKLDQIINDQAILLIAKQQPVATDLRRLIACIRISSDLERMADNAKNIAKATIQLGDSLEINIHPAIKQMHDQTIKMIDLTIDAFVQEDILLARKLAEMDNVVDSLYEKVISEILEEKNGNQKEKQYIIQTALSVRYIERIADHATNIGESIIYLVKGITPDLN